MADSQEEKNGQSSPLNVDTDANADKVGRSAEASPLSSKRRKGKKKDVVPLSIEDVFNQVSIVSASVLNPPLTHIILTPRSAQACLKIGVNPEVLKIRDIDSFWEPNVDPAVQRMRHEAYVQRRHELMKQCRHERRRIVNAEFESAGNIHHQIVAATITPEMLLQHQREQTSTLVKLELQRLEKIQKRQEKELEQMIQVTSRYHSK